MKQISFVEGLGIAVVLSVLAVPLRVLFGGIFAYNSVQPVIVGVTLVYIWYGLLKRSARAGSCVLGLTAAAAGLMIISVAPTLSETMLACGLLIWIVRSVTRYRSVVTIALDGGVSVGASLFGTAAFFVTGFTPFAVWAFFLVQAITAWIPERLGARRGASPRREESFEQACEVAERALAALMSRPDPLSERSYPW